MRTEKRYLSRQHLIEQNAVGPPVHRFVVGLVGHNLRRRQRKRAVGKERADEVEDQAARRT